MREHPEVQRGRQPDLRGQHRAPVRLHQRQGAPRAGGFLHLRFIEVLHFKLDLFISDVDVQEPDEPDDEEEEPMDVDEESRMSMGSTSSKKSKKKEKDGSKSAKKKKKKIVETDSEDD